jgi:alcohol dehydrogenase class IV
VAAVNFQHSSLPWNIIFGIGMVQRLASELDKLKFSRVMVLCSPEQVAQGLEIVAILGVRAVGLFDQVTMHVPMTTVVQAAQVARDNSADCTVSIGGGSTTGLGKALALKHSLPNIAIPTSYAGSEMTNIWGITDGGKKTTGRDNIVLPVLPIYDPELTLTLPPEFAGPSGLNAMAQAVVNVASQTEDPFVSSMALDAIRALANGLPVVMAEPDNIEARSEVLLGACFAGGAIGAGTASLHHRLCHIFGGTFGTSHAETHAVLLPHSVAYNAAATVVGTGKIAQAMGVEDAAVGLYELARTVGAPTALRDIGVAHDDLDRAVVMLMESPPPNPEPVTAKRLRALLENAFQGVEPRAIE